VGAPGAGPLRLPPWEDDRVCVGANVVIRRRSGLALEFVIERRLPSAGR
jgi:hypothetical protein